jgi:glycosyltransferase involved in cell wall biosynthesis
VADAATQKPPARVDVAIPVAGRSRYLREAIDSVVSQSFADWRLLVSHDGPDDGDIRAVVAPYLDDPRIGYRRSEQRLGAPRHMTELVRSGSAEYVALLHDDDRWQPEFLARRVRFLDEHPGCGFVFGGARVVDSEGRYLERWSRKLPVGVLDRLPFMQLLLGGNLIPSPSVVVRRSAYASVGSEFNGDLHRIYDYEMWVRLALRFDVGFVGVDDADWRVHDAQSTRELHDRARDYDLLVRRIEPEVRRFLPELAGTRRQWMRIQADWLLTNGLDALEQGERRLAIREATRAIRISPTALADLRVPVALLALALGDAGSHALRRSRTFVRRRNIGVHLLRHRRMPARRAHEPS